MSNGNSSTRSQLTSTSGISNRNANISSSKIENRRNRNYSLKTCNLSWNTDTDRLFGFGINTSSPEFSSVDDDLKWHLECSGQLRAPQSISILLKLYHDNGVFEQYNAISGDAELSVMRTGGYRNVQKKKNFETQNKVTGNTHELSCVRFSDFADHTSEIWERHEPNEILLSNELKIVCKVTYRTIEKKIHESPFYRLSDDLENLLINTQFSNAIVVVKGIEYPVYKGILAARSPVFEVMFREDNHMIENTTNVVEISDFSPEVIEEMLLFIYTGKTKKLEKLAYELLPAADKYELEELMEICEYTLFKQLSKDNVINILILAHTHNAHCLKAEALQFIKSHSRSADLKDTEIWEVLTSYRDLTKDVLAVLLDK